MIDKYIPAFVDDEEYLFRTLYSPFHYDEKKKKLKKSALQPPVNRQDDVNPAKANNKVSTTRKDYASLRFCLQHAHKYEGGMKVFSGFLKIKAEDVRNAGADVEALPVEDNAAHANIVFKCIDMPLGNELDNLTRAEVKECQIKMIKYCEFVPRDIENNQNLIEEDAEHFPDSGVFPYYNDKV